MLIARIFCIARVSVRSGTSNSTDSLSLRGDVGPDEDMKTEWRVYNYERTDKLVIINRQGAASLSQNEWPLSGW